MPQPPKLTLAVAAAVAREADPEAWDAMTPADRRGLVKRVNDALAEDHLTKVRKIADRAKVDRYLVNPGMRPKR